MTYVNTRGEVIDPHRTPSALAPKKPKTTGARMSTVTERSVATHSMGFVVTGWSPEHLIEAEAKHKEAEEEREVECGEGGAEFIAKPWNEEAHMRKAKPPKVRSKPYELRIAADQCAEMARKAGWKNVAVSEVLKAQEKRDI